MSGLWMRRWVAGTPFGAKAFEANASLGWPRVNPGVGRNESGQAPRPALSWVHIAFPAASPLTASKDFVTWSAGEILSSADEKTATILESGAMTNVVRSVNA